MKANKRLKEKAKVMYNNQYNNQGDDLERQGNLWSWVNDRQGR